MAQRFTGGKLIPAAAAVFLLLALLLACGADPTATPLPTPTPTPEPPEEEEVAPGIVEIRPDGAEEVVVSLVEWAIAPRQDTVQAGEVYFLVENRGPIDPHELVVVKSDLAPDQLPHTDGMVDEDKVDIIGEVEEFAPGTVASGVMNLTPGNYILICNLVELEDGELESHYLEGMYTSFTVE